MVEIALKQGNRKLFLEKLKRNILSRIPDSEARFFGHAGRYFLSCSGVDDELVSTVLATTFGLTGYGPVSRCDKELDTITREVRSVVEKAVEEKKGKFFKVEIRRPDKAFKLSSI